jgi:hypothetical protein
MGLCLVCSCPAEVGEPKSEEGHAELEQMPCHGPQSRSGLETEENKLFFERRL